VVQDAIQNWGKLTLVYQPGQADIIILVMSRPSEDVMAVYDSHANGNFLWRVMGRDGLIYTGGVHGKRFSANRFVELVSTAPAKLFGLYPRKGTIAIGSDADLVIFDPNEEQVISAKTHHMRVDYSMFEGIQIKGAPKTVFSRGRAVIDAGKFVGRPGAGQFLRRQTYTTMR